MKNILNEVPAVICTAGSNIIAMQDKITANLSESLVGRELFDYMEPRDIVKFSAHFYDEKIEKVLQFTLNGFLSFSHGIAIFRKILDRRYAVVFLLEEKRNNPEMIASVLSEKAEVYTGYDILSVITHMNDVSTEKSSNIHMIDAESIAEYLISHGHCSDLYIRTMNEAFSKKELHSILLNVPRREFLQIIMLTFRILDALSVQRACTLSFHKFADSLEMRFVTDSLRVRDEVSDATELLESCPATGVYIGLLEYICHLYNARLDIFTEEGSESISLILTFYNGTPEWLDFKSCDCLEGIDDDIEAIAHMIDLVTYKEEEQG